MKRKAAFLWLVLATLSVGNHPARASDDDALDDVRVLLPTGESSEIRAPAPTAAPVRVLADNEAPALEFDVSSWNPSSLTLNSELPSASAFSGSGLPYLSAAYVDSPILRGKAGTLSLRGGVSLFHLERTGTVEVPGAPEDYVQGAYIIPVELGVEARPSVLQWRKAQVYFDAGILPTLMLTERSPFDDGRTLFGLPARFLVGGSYDVRGLLPVSTPTFFELGVSQTVGSVSEGSMNGTGILAGVRVAI